MKKYLFLFTLISAFTLCLSNNSSASAQTPNQPQSISGGVLNGKAMNLAKPSYPPAAHAVGASGAVLVQVTIDENGNVISANAISGHPLLQQASIQAARTSKFAPTLLAGQPVKVTGVIIYNFVVPLTFTQIGYELSLAGKSSFLNQFQYSSIGVSLPQSWTNEIEDLKSLDSHLTSKNETGKLLPPTPPAKIETAKKAASNGTERMVMDTTVAADSAVGIEGFKLDAESIEIINQLQSKIENRLTVNEKILWAFKLGIVLGKLQAEIKSGEATDASLTELTELGQSAPAGISDSVLVRISETLKIAQQNAVAATNTKERLKIQIENLRNTKFY